MGFKYDFDMFSVIPDEVRREFQGMLDEIGMGGFGTEQVALFRDPELAAALQGADQEIRDLFLEAGFGLNTYDSGAPEGRYPGQDEAARNECLNKLADNIAAAGNLEDANWGGFSLDDFLDHLCVAEPIETAQLDVPPAPQDQIEMGSMTIPPAPPETPDMTLAMDHPLGSGDMEVPSTHAGMTAVDELSERIEMLGMADPSRPHEMHDMAAMPEMDADAADAEGGRKVSLARIGLVAGGAMVAASTVGIALRAIAG